MTNIMKQKNQHFLMFTRCVANEVFVMTLLIFLHLMSKQFSRQARIVANFPTVFIFKQDFMGLMMEKLAFNVRSLKGFWSTLLKCLQLIAQQEEEAKKTHLFACFTER